MGLIEALPPQESSYENECQLRADLKELQDRAKAGGLVNEDGDTALHLAIILQETEAALRLLEGPEGALMLIPNYNWQTPLHLAVLSEQPSLVSWLLEARCPLNARDSQGRTALHLAAQMGQVGVVRELLIIGLVDFRAQDVLGRTALSLACVMGHAGVVKALIQLLRPTWPGHRAYPAYLQFLDCRDYNGQSALLLAAYQRRPDLVSLLLEAGADVRSKDGKTGWTALHIGAATGQAEVVRACLSRRPQCDPYAETYDGYVPADLAAIHQHSEVLGVFAEVEAGGPAPWTR